MRTSLGIVLLAGLLAPAPCFAEYRQLDLTIFGMD